MNNEPLTLEEKIVVVNGLKSFINARQGLYTIGKSIGIHHDRIQNWLLSVNPMRNWYCCSMAGEEILIKELEESLLNDD